MTTANLPQSTAAFSLDQDAREALFTAARSAIAFDGREVDADMVTRAWDLAKFGPTSNNTQPLRLVVARSEAARAAVIEAAMPLNRPKLEQAPLLLVAAHDDRFHDHHETWAPGMPAVFDRFESNPEMRASLAHSGAMLQLGYLIVALRAEGLALRPYGGFDKAALDASLMPEGWGSEVILGVGWPASGDDRSGERRGRIPAGLGIREL
ncbi:malonic semialdehyde reductase [Demequina gelatinilytica]|uniref:malonic semialdehyde reductase n=1 Tax=Demequina gelatinilytica TaxID=1638980 RepID=UPI00078156F8|nr:malonic semialdehyde reductase [Demequina gelatinilytica]